MKKLIFLGCALLLVSALFVGCLPGSIGPGLGEADLEGGVWVSDLGGSYLALLFVVSDKKVYKGEDGSDKATAITNAKNNANNKTNGEEYTFSGKTASFDFGGAMTLTLITSTTATVANPASFSATKEK